MGKKFGVDEEDFWRLEDAAVVSIVGLRREEDMGNAPVNAPVNAKVNALTLSSLHSSRFSGYNFRTVFY